MKNLMCCLNSGVPSVRLLICLFFLRSMPTFAADEPLRYQIKPDQVVPYSVKIEAETPAGVETLSGIFAIKGHIASRVKELTKHNVSSVTFSAKQVWKTIEPVIAAADKAAAASREDNPFATDGEKMEKDLNTVREWSDRSGSFKVEAAFVRLENGTVVLKRKDGKEVKVPLSRLNPDDRELAESFGKE